MRLLAPSRARRLSCMALLSMRSMPNMCSPPTEQPGKGRVFWGMIPHQAWSKCEAVRWSHALHRYAAQSFAVLCFTSHTHSWLCACQVRYFCTLEFTRTSFGCEDCLKRALSTEQIEAHSRCAKCNSVMRENKKLGIENEIIEIGSVLIDATTGAIVCTFTGERRFVRPNALPLSDFTTATTTISTVQVLSSFSKA